DFHVTGVQTCALPILLPGDIPVVQADRDGQVTYHGPGQLVCYLMLDVRRLGIGVRELVSRIEQSLIDMLAGYDVQAVAKPNAPRSEERRVGKECRARR